MVFDFNEMSRFVIFLDREAKSPMFSKETSEVFKTIGKLLQSMHTHILDLELELAQQKSARNSILPPGDLDAVDKMLDELDISPEMIHLDDDDVIVLENQK